MRTTFKILLFILCLNLSSLIVYALNVPGTEYTKLSMGQDQNVTLYEQRFNTTNLLDQWTSTPFSGIPVIGDIFSGASLGYNAIKFLILGFPDTLEQFGGLITNESGAAAFGFFVTALKVVFMLFAALWVIEFITGRPLTE